MNLFDIRYTDHGNPGDWKGSWIIYKDYTTGKQRVKIPKQFLIHGREFILYDDDMNPYYRGWAIHHDEDTGFEPLYWAQMDSGCTVIKYYDEDAEEFLPL